MRHCQTARCLKNGEFNFKNLKRKELFLLYTKQKGHIFCTMVSLQKLVLISVSLYKCLSIKKLIYDAEKQLIKINFLVKIMLL